MRREQAFQARGWRCLPVLWMAVLAGACAEVPTDPALPPSTGPMTPAGAMAGRPIYHGVFLGDAETKPETVAAALSAFAARAGRGPALVKSFFTLDSDFSERGWAGRVVRAIRATGSANFVGLDLGWRGAPETGLLDALTRGEADERLTRMAQDLAALGEPILVEPGWEMNGNWGYPWHGIRNGGSAGGPARFVAAWRHVVRLFRAAGATNVLWVFSPNVGNPVAGAGAGTAHWNWYGHYYPGDGWVDYLGAHGFHAPSLWGTPYRDFATLFDGDDADRLLSDLATRFPGKPIIVSEFAAEETPGHDKGTWIREAFRDLHRHPSVVASIWFNMRKETDWRIESSTSALMAYNEAMTHPRVRTRFLEP